MDRQSATHNAATHWLLRAALINKKGIRYSTNPGNEQVLVRTIKLVHNIKIRSSQNRRHWCTVDTCSSMPTPISSLFSFMPKRNMYMHDPIVVHIANSRRRNNILNQNADHHKIQSSVRYPEANSSQNLHEHWVILLTGRQTNQPTTWTLQGVAKKRTLYTPVHYRPTPVYRSLCNWRRVCLGCENVMIKIIR